MFNRKIDFFLPCIHKSNTCVFGKGASKGTTLEIENKFLKNTQICPYNFSNFRIQFGPFENRRVQLPLIIPIPV